jgi:DNA-binding transcriptional LysR family regulator
MELRSLRHLVATAEARTFTRAAGDRGISQPAQSQSVKPLEAAVGHALFVRNRQHPARGLELTPVGELVLSEARLILASVARAERRLARIDASESASSIALGFTAATPPELLTSAIAVPRTRIIPVFLAWGEEPACLSDGRVDLAFMQYPPGSESLHQIRRTLLQCPRMLMVPAGHHLAQREGRVTLDDIAEEAFLDPGFPDTPEMYRDYWLAEPRPHRGPGPHVVPLLAVAPQQMYAYVAAGHALAITSETLARQISWPHVVFLHVDGLSPVCFGIVRDRDERRPAVLELFDAIVDAHSGGPESGQARGRPALDEVVES